MKLLLLSILVATASAGPISHSFEVGSNGLVGDSVLSPLVSIIINIQKAIQNAVSIEGLPSPAPGPLPSPSPQPILPHPVPEPIVLPPAPEPVIVVNPVEPNPEPVHPIIPVPAPVITPDTDSITNNYILNVIFNFFMADGTVSTETIQGPIDVGSLPGTNPITAGNWLQPPEAIQTPGVAGNWLQPPEAIQTPGVAGNWLQPPETIQTPGIAGTWLPESNMPEGLQQIIASLQAALHAHINPETPVSAGNWIDQPNLQVSASLEQILTYLQQALQTPINVPAETPAAAGNLPAEIPATAGNWINKP